MSQRQHRAHDQVLLPRLADCHSHLDRYSPAMVSAMVARARAAGVGLILAAGTDAASSRAALQLAKRFPLIWPCAGLHPLHVKQTEDWEQIASLALQAVAVSETGLDFSPGAPDHDLQREMMRRHLGLGKPAILHLVATDQIPELVAPAAVHYFQGDSILARRYLDAGLFISLGKPVTRSRELQETVSAIPLERLLLETDTYPLPGRTTEPADVLAVANAVAVAHAVSPAEVAEVAWNNLSLLLGRNLPRDRAL